MLVNLFIFSNITSDPNYNDKDLNYKTPVYNFASHPPGGLPAITFASMISGMSKNKGRRYLDLGRRGIISQKELRTIVAGLNKNWDNDDVSVDPRHR